MAEALTAEPIPLVLGPDGVMRVRGTRVTLETVLSAFADGATAEEIAQRYPSASLADLYQAAVALRWLADENESSASTTQSSTG